MKLSQCDKVLRHLQTYGSLTSLEAVTEYGILRLASRINDLKRMGHKISSSTEVGENRFGEKTHYSVYKLEDNV